MSEIKWAKDYYKNTAENIKHYSQQGKSFAYNYIIEK